MKYVLLSTLLLLINGCATVPSVSMPRENNPQGGETSVSDKEASSANDGRSLTVEPQRHG
ncbi:MULTISPECIES: hypothetical protein [Edwardsiella]|uniref:Lipoprotein n=2 Tax=Edwardsiella anguillarum TaxID=1821960 RepID=A0A076LRI1_9GAMM|nr:MULTISPECIES: hypothetical protein [Edwardsiella]AKM48585.1 hypothetical protein QY76_15920 [Edwardsiella sp. EA181011]GAJ67857.1 hypothetical protein MA13_contig00007-0165 [Edwardsiella piscicida]AIJ09163.1 Hypothetical protein ETEE_2730 [Edwardsiella anguillarum ET080813]AKR77093.1 hypothetical protein AAZ33_04535 [Edwardsiella sp. LADL05-105]KAB0589987.1 hypothetical protein F7P84_13210 [Edwardsiella anguillarum]